MLKMGRVFDVERMGLEDNDPVKIVFSDGSSVSGFINLISPYCISIECKNSVYNLTPDKEFDLESYKGIYKFSDKDPSVRLKKVEKLLKQWESLEEHGLDGYIAEPVNDLEELSNYEPNEPTLCYVKSEGKRYKFMGYGWELE